jgi:hypothetical protein
VSGLILPPGVELANAPTVGPVGPGRVIVDNRTDLPDGLVERGVQDYFVENASVLGMNSISTYQQEGGSLLARTKFRIPRTVFEEISLARDMAITDDDVAETIGAMLAIAYEGGMQNFHEDERTVGLFNEIAREANLDHVFKEMYREYLIAAQVVTISLFTRSRLSFVPGGVGERVEERLASPLIDTLHAEDVRVIGSALFGVEELAYIPPDATLRAWLEEFFADTTTAARRNAMRSEDPVAAALFLRPVTMEEENKILASRTTAYVLNPRMAARVTMPKGSAVYPRPLLTSNFSLLEAKRLLNIMDYALLQGGANFVVVAKKGTDQHRAQPEELAALGETVRRASRTGVIVGDHRLSFEIITPKLDELLNRDKRKLLGRKIASRLLRVPEFVDEAGTEAQKTWTEIVTRVVTSDRNDLRRHVERTTYAEAASRNRRVFNAGQPKIWHPKIVLQGGQFFNDYVLKLRDRGDIPRKFAVEAGGFDWEAGVAQRQRELAAGTDDIMEPAHTPFDSPANSPDAAPGQGGDGGEGRPPGARTGTRRDSHAPRRPRRGPGETIRAWWDEEIGAVVRVGEVTYRLLEQYPDREEGRITAFERRALADGEIASEGPVTVVPVNPGHDVEHLRMLRLAPGLGVMIGYRRRDDAILAKAFTFRAPEFDEVAAEELVLRLGYEREDEELPPPAE